MRMLGWIAGGVGVVLIGGIAAWTLYSRSIETWPYEVVHREGDFELRDYPAMTVAEVTTRGDRQAAVREGFRPLARYIFASERPGDKIAMTAPVTQTREDATTWQVRFVMPAQYDLDDLPRPAGADVRIVETEPRRMAAVRFSGSWTDARMERHEARLRDWIASQDLEPVTPPTYAYYNDPFAPGFLRRNEVLIGVEPR